MFLCTSGEMVPLNLVFNRKILSFKIQDKVLIVFEPALDHAQDLPEIASVKYLSDRMEYIQITRG